jgi:F420-dependent oxidoreductase-like protein
MGIPARPPDVLRRSSGLRLGLHLGFLALPPLLHLRLAQEADQLGYHSLWTAEAWGTDCITALTWLAAKTERIRVGTAIMQMAARTPANAAMAAATLDLLTRGRVLMGLGVSGPQVVEGWHGVPYGKPLGRTREYVEIIRMILAREQPLEYHGEHYNIPLNSRSGPGKPLRLMFRPVRSNIPIYLGAIGPKNVALAAEIADGWLPVLFSPERMDLFRASLEAGFARASPSKDRGSFDIAAMVEVRIGDDVAACRDAVKPALALYIGGMGAKDRNFYFNLACRYGYEEAARTIQDAFLDGRRMQAETAVPDALVDEVALCGPKERIAERLDAWRRSGVTTLVCITTDLRTVRTMAELAG